MATTKAATNLAKTNREGFPVVPCYRCGGTGEFSFNQVDGKRCYGCNGTGWAIKRGKTAKAWKAYQAALEAARTVAWEDVQPGDVVEIQLRRFGKVLTKQEDPLNLGNLIFTFENNTVRLGTPRHFTTILRDAGNLPDPAEFTRDL